MVTPEELKDIVSYDKNTGFFYWVEKPRFQNIQAGSKAGWVAKSGYAKIKIKGRTYSAHRLAWFYVYGEWPKNEIDHINEIKTDNRIVNLRDVTKIVNQRNQHSPRKHNKTGFAGVYFKKDKNKFVAQIETGNGKKHIGYFSNPQDAHAAYLVAKNKYHGDAARKDQP